MGNNNRLFVDVGQGMSVMIGLPRITSWDTKSRPQDPKRGTFGFNMQTASLEYWDGDVWYQAALSKT